MGTIQLSTLETLTHKCIVKRHHNNGDCVILLAELLVPCARRSNLRPDAGQVSLPPNTVLASDGSYTILKAIFQEHQIAASFTGIAVTNSNPPFPLTRGIRFSSPPTTQRAFTAELLGIAVGLRMFTGPILSDCRGAIMATLEGKS